MKFIDPQDMLSVSGIALKPGDKFRFRCHPGIACFNRCCRNLNLFLYPYDVLRLKQALKIGSDRFLDRYVDVVLREANSFPDVLLRMAENSEQTCPFLDQSGCTVYADRPDTCRTFPVEQGLRYDAATGRSEPAYFFRPPDFCLGPREKTEWTVETWAADQQAATHNRMTARWARIKRLFQNDPWGAEGPAGPKARMAFTAAYNVDRFRDFVFQSSFLKRYRVKPDRVRRCRRDDTQLLVLGFEWIELFVWGLPSKTIRPKR
jgi:Fe-S-cluster containining protein